jgi:TonB dependent receptor
LNGIILPEGISVFGQSLDPRLISSLTLITGALPAEYGLRTAGIIDLKTKSGVIDPGGAISLYGGSHGEEAPSINYGGSSGSINYFVSGDFLRNDLGIESPDGKSNHVQTSLTVRYSSLTFTPDPLGDLLYNGIAQDAYKQNVAYALQSDAAYKLTDAHTLRGGYFLQSDRSKSLTNSQVIALGADGNQLSDIPVPIADSGAKTEWIESIYLQDEWRALPAATLNFGLRFDKFTAFTGAHQLSPRVNVVWQALPRHPRARGLRALPFAAAV